MSGKILAQEYKIKMENVVVWWKNLSFHPYFVQKYI